MSHRTITAPDGCALQVTLCESSEATAPWMIFLHAGGPDHHSLMPLAQMMEGFRAALPDVRGYGRSLCRDPSKHRWTQYVEDVTTLLDALGTSSAVLVGVGLGATIALRTTLAYPDRIRALVLISVEDIHDEEGQRAEAALLDAFANQARQVGVRATWEPILAQMPSVVGALVRDAIPRSDAESIIAALAIGHDRAFRNADELVGITAPTLIIPGADARHPAALATYLARSLRHGHLADVDLTQPLCDAEQFALACAPAIRAFLRACRISTAQPPSGT